MVRSNRVAQKRPAKSNSTAAMDLGFEDTRKREYTNKRGINKTHLHCTVVVVDFIVFVMNPDYYHVVDLFGQEILFTIYIYIYTDLFFQYIYIYLFF